RKALIVGISDYTSLQQLDFCKNDGTEVYDVLSSLGYEISDKNKLVGEVKGEMVEKAIRDFFGDIRNNPDDILLFYYSGHGVPDVDGDVYIASSDTDPEEPYRRGFPIEKLTKMMQRSISTRVVVILDCCYSGSAKICKGNEQDAAKIGTTIIDEKSRKLRGQGKYILSASQALQDAYALTTGEHSVFTYYLLEGLKGDTESIDSEGNVTPQSLGKYVYRAIMSLPLDKRPRQTPITRAEESGNIILASYPKLKPKKIEDTLASMLMLLREGKVQEFNKMREENLAILPMLDFSMENLHGAHIAGANLSNANLKRIDLSKADLEGANLTNANLYRADLEGANLSNTNCSNTVLETANLTNANLTKANLTNANLTKANLYHASGDLQQAELNGAIYEAPTKTREATVHRRILGDKTKISIAVGIAAVVAVVLTLALFNYYNHTSTTTTTPLNNSTMFVTNMLPHLLPNMKRSYALYEKGDALNSLGNYTEAIQYFDKALAIDPKFEVALYDKGDALNSLGNYTQAIQYLDDALAIDPSNGLALSDRGLALDGLANYKEAITYLDKAIAIDTNDKRALNNKGWALDGLGNYKEALKYLDKALSIDPNYELALNNKGWALDGLGNYTGAMTYLDKAIAMDPKDKPALNNKG
ncbi:MAG: tetratricopeptide repeat protein, partial [Candidatus Nitrosopolaris sp.]